jgi:Rrf2 family protein
MKLTSQSEYALLALIYLARKNSKEYVPIKEIALKQNIPPKFLEQIFTAYFPRIGSKPFLDLTGVDLKTAA